MPSVSRIGKLRNKITIQNTDLTTDNIGGYTTGRSTYITAFAKMTPKGKTDWLHKTQFHLFGMRTMLIGRWR